MVKINPSEITSEHLYLSRRKFVAGIGALAANSLVLAACGRQTPAPTSPAEGTPSPAHPAASVSVGGLEDELTSLDAITNYTNYYEFTT